MILDEKTFEVQVQAVCDELTGLADEMSIDGLVVASGTVLAGRQTIRALWRQLHPPAPPAPEEPDGGL